MTTGVCLDLSPIQRMGTEKMEKGQGKNGIIPGSLTHGRKVRIIGMAFKDRWGNSINSERGMILRAVFLSNFFDSSTVEEDSQ